MTDRFLNHLNANFPFLRHKKLLLAVSGGVDSMVMANLFLQNGYEIAVAHCNFNLRAVESDLDEQFLRDFATAKKLQLFTMKFDTLAYAADNKVSIQVAARRLRYTWFDEVLAREGFDYVLTAHHADDNIETVLINLCRGTGIDGLTGIPRVNTKVVRPLLPFSREEIENYATQQSLKWREDSSNSSDKYLRNKIRHEVIPVLKSLNPSMTDSFSTTLLHLQQAQSMIEDASNIVYRQVVIEKEDKVIFKIFELTRLQNFRAYLYHWLRDFGFRAWEDVYALVDAQSGKQVFGDGFVLLKDREILVLAPVVRDGEQAYKIEKSASITHPIRLEMENTDSIGNAGNDCIFADEDLLEFPLTLRRWSHGDYFFPFGLSGSKKISKYFKDEKFSLIDKSNTWLLVSGSQIVWIVGHRFDERFKVTAKTKNIIKITTLK